MYVRQHNCSLFVVGGGFLFSIVVVAAFFRSFFIVIIILSYLYFLFVGNKSPHPA